MRLNATSEVRALSALVLCGFLAPLAAFVVLSEAVAGNHRLALDGEVTSWVNEYVPETPSNGDAIVGVVTYATTALVALVPLLLLWRRRPRYALFWSLAVGGVVALDPLLKNIYRRPGVDGGSGYTFPSGSAMLSVAAIASLVLIAPRRRTLLVLLGAAVVLGYGVSLVRVDWHYPSDVLAGWSFSLAWVSAIWLLLCAGPAALSTRRGVDPPVLTRERCQAR
jgi:membrane-associated phospholipid phosphatase